MQKNLPPMNIIEKSRATASLAAQAERQIRESTRAMSQPKTRKQINLPTDRNYNNSVTVAKPLYTTKFN
jgi:hypothetical protein